MGTLSFVNAWGIAAKSAYQTAAVSLVELPLLDLLPAVHREGQVGTMPSRQALAADYVKAFPAQKAFAGAGAPTPTAR